MPRLLRVVPKPTFVTLNWPHFWRRSLAHPDYCVVCLTIATERRRIIEVSALLRRLFRLEKFRTKTTRMGKIARIADDRVAYYEVQEPQIQVYPLL